MSDNDTPDKFDPRDWEIERLRWWLAHIRASRNALAVDLREMADNALQGDVQGPGAP
jgi:hypothetical protein